MNSVLGCFFVGICWNVCIFACVGYIHVTTVMPAEEQRLRDGSRYSHIMNCQTCVEYISHKQTRKGKKQPIWWSLIDRTEPSFKTLFAFHFTLYSSHDAIQKNVLKRVLTKLFGWGRGSVSCSRTFQHQGSETTTPLNTFLTCSGFTRLPSFSYLYILTFCGFWISASLQRDRTFELQPETKCTNSVNQRV